MSSDTPKLMKIGPAAKYLCICERTLWGLTNSGQIPTVRIGRSVRFDIVDLDAFIEKQKT